MVLYILQEFLSYHLLVLCLILHWVTFIGIFYIRPWRAQLRPRRSPEEEEAAEQDQKDVEGGEGADAEEASAMAVAAEGEDKEEDEVDKEEEEH